MVRSAALLFLSWSWSSAEVPSPVPLTMDNAIQEALEKSPELAKARLSVTSAGLEEPILLSNLDPQIYGSYLWSDDEFPRVAPAFEGTRTRRQNFDLGITQNTLLGTEASLFWRNERIENPTPFRVLDPSTESSLALEIRQPLLRYFWGRPDVARRRQARAGVKIAQGNLHQSETDRAAFVARVFLDLFYARENIKVAEGGVAVAKRLQSTYQDKRRYGLVEDSDLVQAQVLVETQETELILARSEAIRAENALLSVLQRLDVSHSTGTLVLAAPPEIPRFAATLPEARQTGLARRGDVHAAEAAYEAAQWTQRIAKLDTLPDLALRGSYGVAGLEEGYSGAWSDLSGFDHPVKTAGLSLAIPLQGKRERLTRQSARLQAESTLQERDRVVQRALKEIEDAWENWRLAGERLAAREKLQSLEEKKLKAEAANFRRGRSSTDVLVRFQQDFQRAEQQRLRASVEEMAARVELGRATGTFLRAFLRD